MGSFSTKLMSWLKSQIKYQMTDMSGVLPAYRLVAGTYYLNSSAGQLTYRPKKLERLTSFRDVYINKFETLTAHQKAGVDTREDFIELYSAIVKMRGAKWKANIHTRLRAKHVLVGNRS